MQTNGEFINRQLTERQTKNTNSGVLWVGVRLLARDGVPKTVIFNRLTGSVP